MNTSPSFEEKKELYSSIHFAMYHHLNQNRKNGEPYIVHPLAVMKRIKDLGLSSDIEQAAILHDVIENCDIQKNELKERFGNSIQFLVNSMSKDPKNMFSRDKEGHKRRLHSYLKRLEQGFSKEPELILLKMCDQLDNLRSIFIFPEEKYQRIIHEIQNNYFPIYKKYITHLPHSLRKKISSIFFELQEKIKILEKEIHKSNREYSS